MNPQKTDQPYVHFPLLGASFILGWLVWGLFFFLTFVNLFETSWAILLLLLAVLVLVPLALRLMVLGGAGGPDGFLRIAIFLQMPSAWALVGSFSLEQGIYAGLLSLPWLAFTLLLALSGMEEIRRGWCRQSADWAGTMARIYVLVGGGWTTMSRLGLQPLGFEPVIVLLTGIHFHYAGFVLPLLTGLACRQVFSKIIRGIVIAGVLGSVPAVAVGITVSQLRWSNLPESLSAWLMAISGLLVAGLHLKLAWQSSEKWLIRLLWTSSALSLIFGMILAALYGARFSFDLAWLDIPLMRALHGTANGLGFGLLGLLGWNGVSPLVHGNFHHALDSLDRKF